MKLDKRMSAILAEIPTGMNVADIGADHGYIGINYAIKNPNNSVFGTDISKKSIEKAKITAEKFNLKNYFTKVGDGLTPVLNDKIDVVLISGMGGEEIINILDGKTIFPMYILSPQKNADKVRMFLSKNDLKPIKDYKVFSENKFYDIMVCAKGKYNPSEFELLYGSGEGEDFDCFCEHTKEHLKKLLDIVENEDEKSKILHKINLMEKK